MDCEAARYCGYERRPRSYPKPVPVGKIGAHFDGLLFSDGSVLDQICGLMWQITADFRKSDTAPYLQEMIESTFLSSREDAEEWIAELSGYPQIPKLEIVESENGTWRVVYAASDAPDR